MLLFLNSRGTSELISMKNSEQLEMILFVIFL